MADPTPTPAPTPTPGVSWFTKVRNSQFVKDSLAAILPVVQFLLDQLGKFLGTKKSGHLSGMDVFRIIAYTVLVKLSSEGNALGIPPDLTAGYTFVILTLSHYFAGAMDSTPPAPAA